MENKFYIDDFERFLKDKVDDFKMYPSRRVWHSIYNNMHPGSRWPSISMCITLICTLFLIGYLNTGTAKRSGTQIAQTSKQETASPLLLDDLNSKPSNTFNTTISLADKRAAEEPVNTQVHSNTNLFNGTAVVSEKNNTQGSSTSISVKVSDNKNENNTAVLSNTAALNVGIANNSNPVSSVPDENNIENNSTVSINNKVSTFDGASELTVTPSLQKEIAEVNAIENIQLTNQSKSVTAATISAPAINLSAKPSSIMQLSETDKSWIENYAMYNRPAPKKWKGKLSMQLYFTPSVVYRELKNAAGKSASSMLTATLNNRDVAAFVNHTPSFGFETGTALVFDLLKNVRIKGGLQLNYTRYNVHAYNNYHPSLTSLTMNNENGMSYGTYRSSAYANYYGVDDVKLHSQTYQFSIPAGIDLKLASITNNIDWYAGATVQPTFVFSGRAYLLSSDAKNYVPTNEFMNRFNVNTGLETFLSIRTKSGYTWNIGPQFRRQIFTTNNKVYSIQERLVSYGIKLGISKKL